MVIGIYWLLSKLDWLIYWIISMFFRVIMDLADPEKIKFFEDIEVNRIKQTVLVIVGVLMLFKLVIAAIQYLINPDVFDDKEKGAVGVLKRMVITMALIVLVPVVFDFAFSMQKTILLTIQNVILGTNAENKISDERVGAEMSYTVLQSFIRPNNGGTVGAYGDTSSKIHDIDSFAANAWRGCGIFSADGCHYDYMVVVSTGCGVFLGYVLMSLALDVAIRTIKFAIIQMLSPIPISSYIFGKEKFNKFMKMAGQVYADLFIRMGIIFAIVSIVQMLVRSGVLSPTGMANTGSWIYDMILHVVVICGLFMFARNAPKFITELLGLQDVGTGDMAEMFRPAWQRASGAAAIGGMLASAGTNLMNRVHNAPGDSFGQRLRNAFRGREGLRTAGSMIAGATSSGWHGMRAAFQGKNSNEVVQAGHRRAVANRNARAKARAEGVTVGSRFRTWASDFAGIDTDVSRMEDRSKGVSAVDSAEKALLSRTNDILQGRAEHVNVNSGTMAADLQGAAAAMVAHVGGNAANINNAQLRSFVQRVQSGAEVSLAEINAVAKSCEAGAGNDMQLGMMASLLSEGGNFRRNLKKNATQDIFNGGLAAMGGGTVAHTGPADLDAQFVDLHQKLQQSMVTNAASLDLLAEHIALPTAQGGLGIARNPNETVADYLDRVYTQNARGFEGQIDATNAQISSSLGEEQQREAATRKYNQERRQNNQNGGH